MDVFFSADVIEHLPNPNLIFAEASKVLKRGGLLVCYCPNGAKEREREHPEKYHQNWGMVHPMFVTPEYLRKQAGKAGFEIQMIRSDFWEWESANQDPQLFKDELVGAELLTVGRKL